MAIFYDCLTATQTLIQGIGLTSIASANVLVRKLPWVRGADIPCVLISPINETLKRVNNGQIEVGYGVHVVVITASNQNLTSSHSKLLRWRQQMIDELLSDRLSGVASVIDVEIEPSGLVLPDAFQKQYDASAFVARCISRETV